jgi:hypothetical protein
LGAVLTPVQHDVARREAADGGRRHTDLISVQILNCVVSSQGYVRSKSIGNRISLICIDALISQHI